MSPSLSWIDEDALASSLTRAGISTLPQRAEPQRLRFFDPPTLPSATPPPVEAPYPSRPPSGTEDTAPSPRRRRPAPSDLTTIPFSAPEPTVRIEDTPLPSAEEAQFNEVTASSPRAEEPDLSALAVSARVASLADWLHDTVGDRYYIADPEGLPIASGAGVEELVVSGVALDRAIRSLRGITGAPSVGAASIELDTERRLDTVWCDTPVGRVAVGVVGTTALPQSLVNTIRRHVARTFDWKES